MRIYVTMVILYVTIVILYSHIYRRCRHGYVFGAPYASGIRSIENLKNKPNQEKSRGNVFTFRLVQNVSLAFTEYFD